MNASRVLCLSSRLARWAGLLALATLPLATGACIAQTGTSEGTGNGTTDERPTSGAILDTTNPLSGKNTVQASPPGPGPVLGPIPSPWGPQPTSGDPTASSGVSGTGGGGPSQEPLPSPWMNSGGTTTPSTTPPPGK